MQRVCRWIMRHDRQLPRSARPARWPSRAPSGQVERLVQKRALDDTPCALEPSLVIELDQGDVSGPDQGAKNIVAVDMCAHFIPARRWICDHDAVIAARWKLGRSRREQAPSHDLAGHLERSIFISPAEACDPFGFRNVTAVGIDETAAKRGHDSITLFHDLGAGRL